MARAALLASLRVELGDDAVSDDPAERARYEHGWRYGHGRCFAVVRPDSPSAVASVLRSCHRHGVRVQAMGANTGLVAASNPDATGEQLVLSLERLDGIVEIDPADGSAVVEAGVRLSQLNEALEPHGLWFPIDLGADPQIGGMVATNTGGTRLVRYGDVRQNLLGLEVALADGRTVDMLQRLRKNNTGLDLKQLFVGTSGVFGVITRAALKLAPRPAQTATAMVALRDGQSALDLLQSLGAQAGDALTAFEVLSANALELTLRHCTGLRAPFPGGDVPSYCALVELSSTFARESLDLEAMLVDSLQSHAESVAGSGVTEVSFGRAADFWAIRHGVTESVRQAGEVLAFDVSVPRSRLAEFSMRVRSEIQVRHPFVTVCDYGHWGDGGSHVNLVWSADDTPADRQAFWKSLQDLVYHVAVVDFAGSFSAEHGVGPHNLDTYRRYAAAEQRAASALLKRHFDPDGRLGTFSLD